MNAISVKPTYTRRYGHHIHAGHSRTAMPTVPSDQVVLSGKPDVQTRLRDLNLTVGRKPDYASQLLITQQTALEVVRSLAGPATLFITDAHNYPTVSPVGTTEEAHDTTADEIHRIEKRSDFDDFNRIVGVGGCAALDVAKSVAIGKDELVVVPTILSTNCITKDRSVVEHGLEAFSYRTTAPHRVIVPLQEMMGQEPRLLAFWSQSGWGDFFAKLSAMTDQLWTKGQAAGRAQMQDMDSDVLDGLDWVNTEFHGFDESTLTRLARHVHQAGEKVNCCDTNDTSVGGEHKFYYAMMDLYPALRHKPSHGQVVAVGTLLTLKAHATASGDAGLYESVRTAFERLGLPLDFDQLAQLGMTREVLVRSLERISQPDVKPSFLGAYVRENGCSVLDEVFGRSTEEAA